MHRRFGVTMLAVGALLAGSASVHGAVQADRSGTAGQRQDPVAASSGSQIPREWSRRTAYGITGAVVLCVPREWSEPPV